MPAKSDAAFTVRMTLVWKTRPATEDDRRRLVYGSVLGTVSISFCPALLFNLDAATSEQERPYDGLTVWLQTVE